MFFEGEPWASRASGPKGAKDRHAQEALFSKS